jgi:hypothetical protein
MSRGAVSSNPIARDAISALLEGSAPVLVEVRFPGCAAAADWYLLGDSDEFDRLLDRLGPGAELHISSVWDLKNVKGEIVMQK